MMAVQTNLNPRDLPDNLHAIPTAIEAAVPHGRTSQGGRGDKGAWHHIPERNLNMWDEKLKERYETILEKHPKLDRGNHSNHLGTLGTGNHFIEVCLDESERCDPHGNNIDHSPSTAATAVRYGKLTTQCKTRPREMSTLIPSCWDDTLFEM
jgi:hypothetical protein